MPVTELQGTRVSQAYNSGGRPISTAMAAVWLERVLSGPGDSASEGDQQPFAWSAGWVDGAARLGRHYRMRERLPRPWLSASREDDETPEQQLFAALDLRLADAGEEAAHGGVATLLSWIAARPHPGARGYVIGLPTNTVAVAVAVGGEAYLFDPDAGVFHYASAAALAEDAANYIHGSSAWFRNHASRAYGYAVSLNRPLEEEDATATHGLTRGGRLTRGRGAASEPPPVERRPTGRLFGASKLRRRQGDALAGARLRSGAPRTELALVYADYVTETFSGGQSTRRAIEAGARKDAPPDAQWPLIGLRLDRRRLVSRITFQLVVSGPRGPVPIWSETWDRRTARAKLRELGQYSHPRLKDEDGRPLKWTAAIPWSELVTVEYTRRAVDDPFPGRGNPFPDGALPAAYAPYKLYLTVNDGASDSGGHMMVAATFLNLAGQTTADEEDEEQEEGEVVDGERDDGADQQAVDEGEQDAGAIDEQDTAEDEGTAEQEDALDAADHWSDWDWSEDDLTEIDEGEVIVERNDAIRSLCLQLAGMAGVAYTLDDGILDPSDGVIDENELLIHDVSELSGGCVISFADGTPDLELAFEAGDEDEEDWLDGEDGEDDEWLEGDDPEPALSMIFARARDTKYRLTFFHEDQVLAVVRGKLEAIEDFPEDGLLVQEIPRGATRSEILLKGQAEPLELTW